MNLSQILPSEKQDEKDEEEIFNNLRELVESEKINDNETHKIEKENIPIKNEVFNYEKKKISNLTVNFQKSYDFSMLGNSQSGMNLT